MRYYALLLLFMVAVACSQRKEERVVTPWGEVNDTIPSGDDFDLDDILRNGELIMLTVSGPETYYDYHGKALGMQYMLCQRFAERIGVGLRVEVCRDTAEVLRKIEDGDGDIGALMIPRGIKGYKDSLLFCGPNIDSLGIQWIVTKEKPELAEALNNWYIPKMLLEVKEEEGFLLSAKSVKRRMFSPMLDRKGGIISHYDGLFMAYAQPIRWDWRLLAAQCYQESTFDPQATSWAGACGLMQIMPGTAAHLGLPMSKIYEPEHNIAAATKYLAELEQKFEDIRDRYERVNFILACYNGGYHHIRDAMALTQKNGKNPRRWEDVSEYVLKLSTPQYYNDTVVKHGYMRGNETVDYVMRIRNRWQSYRGVKSPHGGFSGVPRKATHQRKKKYSI